MWDTGLSFGNLERQQLSFIDSCDDTIGKIQQPSAFPVALCLLFTSGSLLSGTGHLTKHPKGYTGGASMAFMAPSQDSPIGGCIRGSCRTAIYMETLDFPPPSNGH